MGGKLFALLMLLTVPIPSMANTTVAKNNGMRATGAIQGRDSISGNGIDAAIVALSANGLTPVTTHVIVHPKPTSMKVVPRADSGTNTLSVRIIPSGMSGMTRAKIQIRMEKCHSGGV